MRGELAAALRERGYGVEEEVGQSHFRVDLAVRRPDDRAHRLGILLDPAERYERVDTLEREMMRPRLLRDFGWRLASVLAKDWYVDPERELARILALLEEDGDGAEDEAANEGADDAAAAAPPGEPEIAREAAPEAPVERGEAAPAGAGEPAGEPAVERAVEPADPAAAMETATAVEPAAVAEPMAVEPTTTVETARSAAAIEAAVPAAGPWEAAETPADPAAGRPQPPVGADAPRRFEYRDDRSSKFWEIAVAGPGHTVHFGRLGTAGQSKTHGFASAAEARLDADRLIREKVRKGYREVAG